MTRNRKSTRTAALAIGIAALMLTGCAATPALSSSQSGKAAAASAAANPDPEPTGSEKNGAKPGFVDTVDGAPRVDRAGQKKAADRLTATRATFAKAAKYPGGISLTADDFSRGNVHSQGTGIITGAPYIVFKLSLHNGSMKAVDVSQVVVTLKYGPDATAAAPLYDDVPAKDFSGQIQARSSETSTYAFLLPKDVTAADLYVDVNGDLLPAHFEGELPQ
jgi:hypothetical protein